MPKRTDDGLKKRCPHTRKSWPMCDCPWWFGFHHGGREYRYSLTKIARHRQEDPPATKDAAIRWRDRLRLEIRSGTFIDPDTPVAAAPADTRLTLGDVCNVYLEQHVRQEQRREGGRLLMEWYLAGLRRLRIPAAHGTMIALEDKPIADITTADVEAVGATWPRRAGSAKGGRVGRDRALKRLRHLFNWAIEHGYVDHTPFKRHGKTVIHFTRDRGRIRRLEPGEEARLLQHAPPFLQALITAALETGCRKGELLGLTWQDVKTDVLLLPAHLTKAGVARDVPITQRLRAMLELRQYAPDGRRHPVETFVFGNEVGEQVLGFREAWEATCRAAGITDLHFHDLRREFGSRLLETPGISVHHVRDWLGHADLATTSQYLATTRVGLQQARRVFEQHRASAVFAQFSHNPPADPPETEPGSAPETPPKSLN
jgi:integrase